MSSSWFLSTILYSVIDIQVMNAQPLALHDCESRSQMVPSSYRSPLTGVALLKSWNPGLRGSCEVCLGLSETASPL